MADIRQNVVLSFSADDQKLRQSLQNLQKTLTELSSASPSALWTRESNEAIIEAQKAATQLQIALKNATNVDTGKLNLSKFNAELQQSGHSIQDYRTQLALLGPEGRQAFMQVTEAVMQADTQLKYSSKILNNLWETFKQTAKFQFTGSIYRGLTSGLQSAFNYAEELNASLNEIRIVTGKSAADMSSFAKEANAAAQALSTTTTEYSNASLIFYQQGLSENEVKERTDITIKMANASGESAQTVSDQLTAVWNNFYDGSKSLEYYVDVMTKLGAETASSADEISGGLEKFASVADTVGLSYEYAASALATITAETRESEEVVGNALKTIFARVQGLNLGETLEDGTDLNKYSEALQSVGISIFNQNGELKEMDNILDEMGAKWGTLAKDQQMALAQTVAGVRQYTQLIALMDNWDVMQENLDISYNSTGALQEQADIYAESWEAAQKRVKSAAESIYNSLINDKFFISLNNVLADILGLVDKLIDSVGGLPGVLGAVGVIFTKVFNKQLIDNITQAAQSLYTMTPAGRAAAQATKQGFVNETKNMLDSMGENSQTAEEQAYVTTSQKRLELQQQFLANAKEMSEEEKQYYQHALDVNQAYADRVTQRAQEQDAAKSTMNEAIEDAKGQIALNAENLEQQQEQIAAFEQGFAVLQQSNGELGEAFRKTFNEDFKFDESGAYENIVAALEDIQVEGEEASKELERIKDIAQNQSSSAGFGKLQSAIEAIKAPSIEANRDFQELCKKLGLTDDEIKKVIHSFYYFEETVDKTTRAVDEFNEQSDSLKNKELLPNFDDGFKNFAAGVTGTISSISSLVMGFSSLKGAWTTLTNEDMSFWEKFTSILASLSMGIPTIINGFSSLSSSVGSVTTGISNMVVASIEALSVQGEEVAGNTAVILTEQQKTAVKNAGLRTQLLYILSQKTGIEVLDQEGKLLTKDAIATQLDAIAKGELSITTTLAAGAQALLNGELATAWALLGPIVIAIVAVAAAVGLVIAGYQQLKNTSPAAQLQKAQEETKKAAEEFEAASTRVEELKENIQSLEDAYEALNKITTGTEEFATAMTKANEEALQLLDTYSGLAAYTTVTDDGLIKIDEQGFDFITNQQENAAQAKYNVMLQKKIEQNKAQMVVAQESFNNDHGIFIKNSASQNGGKQIDSQQDFYDNLIQAYNREDVELSLFTNDGFEKVYEELYGKFETSFKEGTEQYNEALKAYNDKMLAVKDVVDQNRENIINQANLAKSGEIMTNSQENSIISQMASQLGSISTAEEFQDMGISYKDVQQQQRETVKKTVNAGGGYGWRDHQDYNAEKEQWIKDFMAGQGKEVKYVGQEHGKMVLEIDGVEQSFSRQEVIDQLTEYYTSEDMRSSMISAIKSQVSESVEAGKTALEAMERSSSGLSIDNLNDDQLVSIHNLQKAMQSGMDFSSAKFDEKSEVDGVDVAQAYVGGITDQLAEQFGSYKELADAVSSLSLASEESRQKIQEQTQAAAEGRITMEELANSIKEINAISSLEGMSEQLTTMAETYDLDAEQLKKYSKYIMEMAKESEELSDNLATDAQAAAAFAKQVLRMNKGVESLSDNFDDWNSILKKSSKSSVEYMEASEGMREALGDILDIDGSELSLDFITNNLDLIQKAATGSGEAIDALRSKLSEEIVATITTNINDEKLKNDILNLNSKIQDMTAGLSDIELDAKVNSDEFLAAANDLVQKAQMTADQANAYFASIGYEPLVLTEDVENEQKKEDSATKIVVDSIGFTPLISDDGSLQIPKPYLSYHTESEGTGEKTVGTDTTSVTGISGDGTMPKIQQFRKKASGNANNYSSKNTGGGSKGSSGGGGSGGGGGGGSKTKAKPNLKKKEDIKRFTDSDTAIGRLDRSIDRLGKKREHLWGKEAVDSLAEENKLLEEQDELIRKQIDEAKDYMVSDLAEIDKLDLGVDVEFNDDGEIANKEGLEATYKEKYNAMEQWYADQKNALGDDDEALEALNEQYEAEKEAMERGWQAVENYSDAVTKVLEGEEKLEDSRVQQLSNIYTGIVTKMEKINELHDKQLTRIERANKLLGESWQNAPTVFDNNLKQYDQTFAQAQEYYDAFAALDRQEYNDDEWAELANTAIDGIDGAVDKVLELNETMKESYANMVDKISEEFDKLYSQFDHLTTVTENYLDLLSLIGEEKNYDLIGDLLETTQSISRNKFLSAQDTYETSLEEYKIVAAEYEKMDAAAKENFQSTYDKALEKMQSSREEALSSLTDYVNNSQQVLENALAKNQDALERALFGGMTSDEMSEYMDSLQAKTEDYLTETNQQYETQKLINTANLAIENTSNEVAKKKLQTFVKGTEQLQKQAKLSNLELEIRQAEYEVLLAEIALQEAQNAKSQVRLSRDSEGNFNYVYTADENEIAEAQQAFEDAENNLYNIRLDGANEYAQKTVEVQQELLEKLQEIAEDEYLSTEEKQERMADLCEEYYDRLGDIQSIYSMVSEQMGDQLSEAWTTDMMDNIATTGEFADAVDDYLDDCGSAMDDWQEVVDYVSGYVGSDFDEMTKESNELKQGIYNLNQESSAALSQMTTKVVNWAAQVGGQVRTLINYFNQLAESITEAYSSASGYSADTNWMAVYENSNSIAGATSALENRILKVGADEAIRAQWGTNEEALMEGDHDQTVQMQNAGGTSAQMFNEAIQRYVKLMYIDKDVASQMVAENGTVADIMDRLIKDSDSTWEEFINKTLAGNSAKLADLKVILGHSRNLGRYNDIINQYLSAYDTGGYTGDFGPEGKIGLLHEKELVLNAQDTSNLLKTVDIVRELLEGAQFPQFINQLTNLNLPTVGNFGDTLQQEVTITAEFPNVQDRNEIEEAFNNIVNMASQYANRKSY